MVRPERVSGRSYRISAFARVGAHAPPAAQAGGCPTLPSEKENPMELPSDARAVAPQEPSPPPTSSLAADLHAPTVSRAYQCQCGRPVFLANSECLACHTPLGYVIESLGVVPLAPAEFEGAEPETWTVFGD